MFEEKSIRLTNFNPRSPYGERPGAAHDAYAALCISIHAPLTGSDPSDLSDGVCKGAFQSTLPLRGATYNPIKILWEEKHFNPRSPYGERHPTGWRFGNIREFQSTLPLRGATCGV